MADGEFSVFQFFADGSHERVREGVDAEAAVKAAHHYCTCIGAQLGTTRRVIITDADDFCNFEWKHGEGSHIQMSRNLSDELNKADFRLRNSLHDARNRGGCMIALLALPVVVLAALVALT